MGGSGAFNISNLTDGKSYLSDFLSVSGHWIGDFDDDDIAELGTSAGVGSFTVREIVDSFGVNREATETIAIATKDFASNLLTDDNADFAALWREHGPSASTVALALVLDMPFSELLDMLYSATDRGEGIRQTVTVIREARQ